MAPIPSTNLPALPTSFIPWIMWLVVIVLALSGLASLFFIVRWVVFKTQNVFKSFQERREIDRMVLPTHLRPFVLRPVILPLPAAHYGREKMAYEEQCRMREMEEAQLQAHQSSKQVSISSSTHCALKSSAKQLVFACKSKLVSVSSSSQAIFKKAKPTWVLKLIDRMKMSTHMVPSQTMDLPMQMPPPGWEDEIEPPREDPPNINNNDELFRKAMAKMDASIRRGPGPYRPAYTTPQRPATDSCAPSVAAHDALDDSHEDDHYSDTPSSEDTPVLSSISDISDDEDQSNALPLTPPLADAIHPLHVAPTHSIVDIDKHIAAVTGYTSPNSPFGFDSYDSLDEIDRRIAATTGFSPQKLHMEALLERTPSPPAQPAVLDLVDLRIAVLTAQCSPRSSPPSPASVYSPSPGRTSTPRHTRPHPPTTDTPQTPTRGPRQPKITSPTIGMTRGTRSISTSSPLADTNSSSPIPDSLFSPTSSVSNDTPVQISKAPKTKTQLSDRLGIGSRALPRPLSLPTLPALKRPTSTSRRLSTPSTPTQPRSSSLTPSSTTRFKDPTSRPPRPPFIASSSTRLRPVARSPAAPPSKEPIARALPHKILVSFEPTSTPSPLAKKMWRSLAPSDTTSARTRTRIKPVDGVGTKWKPTWRP